jgi:hypothetical protein
MLTLTDARLRVEVLDPEAAAELPLQGLRFCRGGYVWQVHDERLGPLLSGPEYPAPAPVPFNGQGLPESFRHRTRDGRPLTWRGGEGLAPGIGRLGLDARGEPILVAPCAWTITRLPGQLVFQTRDAGAGLAYELAPTTSSSRCLNSRPAGRSPSRSITPQSLAWSSAPALRPTSAPCGPTPAPSRSNPTSRWTSRPARPGTGSSGTPSLPPNPDSR